MKEDMNMKNKYYFETQTSSSPKSIIAENDQQAIERLKQEKGDKLQIIYMEESKDNFRTVWERI